MKTLVLHMHDVARFGCPNCGCIRAHVTTDWFPEAQIKVCVECLNNYIALADELRSSRLSMSTAEDMFMDRNVTAHPREGQQAHDPGVRPGEDEYFYPLGIEQFEAIDNCFACGSRQVIGKTLVGQVLDLKAQQRVLSWFDRCQQDKANLLRMKIDACGSHEENLHRLFKLLRDKGILSMSILREVGVI